MNHVVGDDGATTDDPADLTRQAPTATDAIPAATDAARTHAVRHWPTAEMGSLATDYGAARKGALLIAQLAPEEG
ncbi:hypothetical protein ACFWOJ_27865 [Streptomyces sp. NPDC058439]|uniref:hypothetical protein n=1 Tax=Streptomyces sp. NPDC058439 TaxID=3346500 RepID=UPI0036487ACA